MELRIVIKKVRRNFPKGIDPTDRHTHDVCSASTTNTFPTNTSTYKYIWQKTTHTYIHIYIKRTILTTWVTHFMYAVYRVYSTRTRNPSKRNGMCIRLTTLSATIIHSGNWLYCLFFVLPVHLFGFPGKGTFKK